MSLALSLRTVEISCIFLRNEKQYFNVTSVLWWEMRVITPVLLLLTLGLLIFMCGSIRHTAQWQCRGSKLVHSKWLCKCRLVLSSTSTQFMVCGTALCPFSIRGVGNTDIVYVSVVKMRPVATHVAWSVCLSVTTVSHRRKLLLGPGAQAPPHFYDHGARLYDEPSHFCDVILSKLCFNCSHWFYAVPTNRQLDHSFPAVLDIFGKGLNFPVPLDIQWPKCFQLQRGLIRPLTRGSAHEPHCCR